ncbi:aquaporin family protein [Acidithiobacillus sp. 'AMD consortium']|uniref:Aquaporin Z n=3 Tax=Acidithiobacillus ferridurans TaxID=1232575 RepID=A0A2Z6IH61_ACIFI|nr:MULTISPECIES: MIP/aquaporin family protein [Acidithiobacillus]MBU2715644.1 aquaporin family protein [Acidithiobacillus ferridurans]MBU2727287.1 aquaporin family protein [Acidithiobacillus ferridurans]MBU2732124.1 aquaporin family protein [Acidithiobacillus ferridurans]QFG77378.1 aquaporin family protein [Acidithiobacillus sp. 'AMD consortium']RBM02360.1 aquaporin family protein [Acidithiobacillus ferridurans]
MCSISRKMAAEFIGTFGLIFFGGGAAAMGYPLIDVALANGLAIMIAAYVFGDISGGVVNPAVTLGGAIAGKIGWKDAGLYMVAQVGGGIAAGYVLLVVLGGSTGHLGATTINTGLVSVSGGFILEALGTFFLTTTALYTAMSGRAGNAAPLAIGFTLVMAVTFMGPLTGASLNPARTLGPAVAGVYFPHIWVYLVATPVGGLIAGLLYNFMQEHKAVS